jgi:hypothetical protein
MQDACLYGHGFDPIELVFGLFAISGGDQIALLLTHRHMDKNLAKI